VDDPAEFGYSDQASFQPALDHRKVQLAFGIQERPFLQDAEPRDVIHAARRLDPQEHSVRERQAWIATGHLAALLADHVQSGIHRAENMVAL
jgi:hypothetical protein